MKNVALTTCRNQFRSSLGCIQMCFEFYPVVEPIKSNTKVKHEKTVLFGFGVLPNRPSAIEIKKFLDEKCNLDMSTVKTIQLRTLDDHVAIIFASASIAAKFVDENKSKTFTTSDGLVSSPMPCWIDEEPTTVRVHDLPPEMPSKDIWNDMAKYGNVTPIYHANTHPFFEYQKQGQNCENDPQQTHPVIYCHRRLQNGMYLRGTRGNV